jgi:hypothetical protein
MADCQKIIIILKIRKSPEYILIPEILSLNTKCSKIYTGIIKK